MEIVFLLIISFNFLKLIYSEIEEQRKTEPSNKRIKNNNTIHFCTFRSPTQYSFFFFLFFSSPPITNQIRRKTQVNYLYTNKIKLLSETQFSVNSVLLGSEKRENF
jgi:hypothetical protein